jgi:hypothetical protein
MQNKLKRRAHLINVTHDDLLNTTMSESLPGSRPLATTHYEDTLWAVRAHNTKPSRTMRLWSLVI